jgi:N4-gp56 family major capsid protein
MSEQRVPFSVREEGKMGLADWFSDAFDSAFFNQVCGNTDQATGTKSGNNATVAASTTRIQYADGTHSSDASLSTTDVMQLTFLDRIVAKVKVATPTMRPIRYKGGEYYVAFLHPYQVYSLRTDATANRVTWYDTQKALVQGGQGEDSNGIFTGALGVYNNIILHEATRIPDGISAPNVRRAVLCGAQAACMAFGQADDGLMARWTEKYFDYENQLGIAGAIIWGLKKSVFNSTDFGTYVLSTYAAAPA